MTAGRRKLWRIAPLLALGLAAFGLAALAAGRDQPAVQTAAAPAPAPACSSCDARNANLARLRALHQARTAP
jgi:hypothetical protein